MLTENHVSALGQIGVFGDKMYSLILESSLAKESKINMMDSWL